MLCSLLGSRRFAREQFESEVDQGCPDSQISLAKACLLVALEEEAAVEADLLQQKVKQLTPLHKSQQPSTQPQPQDSTFQPEGPYRCASVQCITITQIHSTNLASHLKSVVLSLSAEAYVFNPALHGLIFCNWTILTYTIT